MSNTNSIPALNVDPAALALCKAAFDHPSFQNDHAVKRYIRGVGGIVFGTVLLPEGRNGVRVVYHYTTTDGFPTTIEGVGYTRPDPDLGPLYAAIDEAVYVARGQASLLGS